MKNTSINDVHNIYVDGSKIAVRYRPSQTNNLIVFIHGLASSSGAFSEAWDFSGLKDISLLAFDLPGFGLSQAPSQFLYRLEDHAHVCELLLAQFPAKRVHIVAHSMGGTIGLILTRKYLPASFVNIEGNLIGADCKESRIIVARSESDFIKVGFDRLKRLWSGYPENCFDFINVKTEAIYRSAESLVHWSDSEVPLEIFNSLVIPRLYIYGEKNAGLPVIKRLNERIETVMVPASGHNPMIENAEVFYSELAKFIYE